MMNRNIYKPSKLVQVNAPFSYVAHELNDIGQPYEMIGANIDDVKPSQAFIDSDIVTLLLEKLKNGEELKAMWLDKDNNALDGHHRYVAYKLHNNTHVPAVRLMCDKDTAIKYLNDIQSKFDGENNSEFINALFENQDTSMYTPKKKYKTGKTTIKAYRKKPIIEKSISGNFFSVKEIPEWKPYEIEFSGLLNSDDVDPKIKDDKNPPALLAQAWFPDLNFEEKAKQFEMHLGDFINTIVAEEARTRKIDGILYGDKLLQSIDKK